MAHKVLVNVGNSGLNRSEVDFNSVVNLMNDDFRRHLYGLGGNDILTANGNGADFLDGGEGSDTYNVDNSDAVQDAGTTGTDTIVSSGAVIRWPPAAGSST